MKCRNCGTENPDHAKFCNECGAKLKPAISLKKDDPPPAFMDRTYTGRNNRPVSAPGPVAESPAPPMEPEPEPPLTGAPVFFSSSTPNHASSADLPHSSFSEPPFSDRNAAVPEVLPNLRLTWGEEDDDEDEPEEPWYENTWVCIAALLLFFPLGVFLLWKFHKKWGKLCNAAITAGFAIVSLPLTMILLNLILTVHPTDLEILNDDYFLNVNDTAYVDLYIEPEDASSSRIYFGSSDEQVAIFEGFIDDGKLRGKLTAVGAGTSTISLCADGVQGNTVSVTVTDPEEEEWKAQNFSMRVRLIKEVTLDKATKIKGLVKEYNAFPDRIKKLIPNAEVLMEANRTLEQLQKEERERINQAIQEAIAAIDQIGEVTLEKQDLISSARTKYEDLPQSEWSNVSNYNTLISAEKTLHDLQVRQKYETTQLLTAKMYRQRYRDPYSYKGEPLQFQGKITRIFDETEEQNTCLIQLYEGEIDTDYFFYIAYSPEDLGNFPIGEYVTVYGTLEGTDSYSDVLAHISPPVFITKTVPFVKADMIELS